MRSQLLHAIAWLTTRHINHFEAQQKLIAVIGAWFMKRAHAELFFYYQATRTQHDELKELKALDAALEIKKLATDADGKTTWPDHAAIGLNMVAGVLIEHLEWEPEDVAAFVDDLTDGHFALGLADEDEE